MARGDKPTYNSEQQSAFQNAQQETRQGQANSAAAFAPALQGYQSLLANPGYSPAQQQAMTQAVTGSLAGAFGNAATHATNAAARTGNMAGYNATEEQLGREQAQQNAEAMGGLQQAFANDAQAQQQAALRGLSSLYGSSNPQISSGLGAQSSLVGTQGRVAITPNPLTQGLLGRLGSAGASLLGMGGGAGGGR